MSVDDDFQSGRGEFSVDFRREGLIGLDLFVMQVVNIFVFINTLNLLHFKQSWIDAVDDHDCDSKVEEKRHDIHQ